jgi:Fe2+ transport system protein FeoA
MASLDQLRVGQRACVAALVGTDAIVQRLLEMGLLEGEELEVIGFAPLGDPMEIRLRDYRLSLRRSEAARILVQPLEGKSQVPNPKSQTNPKSQSPMRGER